MKWREGEGVTENGEEGWDGEIWKARLLLSWDGGYQMVYLSAPYEEHGNCLQTDTDRKTVLLILSFSMHYDNCLHQQIPVNPFL